MSLWSGLTFQSIVLLLLSIDPQDATIIADSNFPVVSDPGLQVLMTGLHLDESDK